VVDALPVEKNKRWREMFKGAHPDKKNEQWGKKDDEENSGKRKYFKTIDIEETKSNIKNALIEKAVEKLNDKVDNS